MAMKSLVCSDGKNASRFELQSHGNNLELKRFTRFPANENRNNLVSKSLWCKVVRDAFLPQKYPHSVSSDYFEYQIWDSLQALFSSISGTLAAHATFEGLGVGKDSASVSGATIIWIMKTSTGMIGSIVFAFYQSSSLDSYCKEWRLFADILNDISLFLAIISPIFPPFYFVFLSCLSNLFLALVSVAGSTTRAALRVHQARDNNMADVCAKDNSQEQLVNLVGLLLGFIVTTLIGAFGSLFLWSMFIIAVLMHLFCNYRAVRCISMSTLNPTRFRILSESFMNSRYEIKHGGDIAANCEDFSVDSVNKREVDSFWKVSHYVSAGGGVQHTTINVGSHLEDCCSMSSMSYSTICQTNDSKLLINCQWRSEWKPPSVRAAAVDTDLVRVNVALSSQVDTMDVVRAYFIAQMCVQHCSSNVQKSIKCNLAAYPSFVGVTNSIIDEFDKDFEEFRRICNNNHWTLDDSLLLVDVWRFSAFESNSYGVV